MSKISTFSDINASAVLPSIHKQVNIDVQFKSEKKSKQKIKISESFKWQMKSPQPWKLKPITSIQSWKSKKKKKVNYLSNTKAKEGKITSKFEEIK